MIDPEDETLDEGTVLGAGRYEILHRLGRGGVATVYLAQDNRLHARVALKILSKQRAQNADAIVRFENEIAMAANLPPHPNIVRPYEMGRLPELGDRPYISMEYVRGPTLADLVMVRPLAPAKACRLMLDVAEALVFLHERGIVHRDVKPSNVIVDKEGDQRAKLLDFGYAFDVRAYAAAVDDRLTHVDHRPGTKHYMAPEQARGDVPAPSFDVYALAVSLYELLVGNPPYHTHSPHDVVRRKVDPSQPSISIKGVRPGLPAQLETLVDRGLERDPEQRIPSAAAFRDGLGLVLDLIEPGWALGGRAGERAPKIPASSSSTKGPVPLPGSMDPEQRRRRSLGVMVAAAAATMMIVAIVVGVVIGLLRSDDRGAGEAARAAAPAADRIEPEVAVTAPAAMGDTNELEPEPKEAPVPEAKAEPEVEPSEPPEPPEAEEPHESPPRKIRPSAPEASPEPRRAPCDEVLEEVAAAERQQRWATVVRLTARRDCWTDPDERLVPRVNALFELQRYEQCVAVMRETKSPEVHRTAKSCETMLAKEPAP